MKAFLDTNILIDFITERDGVEEASTILQLGEENRVELATSILSMANVAYIARRGRTRDELYEVLRGLSDMIEILPMDSTQYKRALDVQVADFEDMLQYQCALAMHCDVIITRNKRDFPFSNIPLYTSKEFIDIES